MFRVVLLLTLLTSGCYKIVSVDLDVDSGDGGGNVVDAGGVQDSGHLKDADLPTDSGTSPDADVDAGLDAGRMPDAGEPPTYVIAAQVLGLRGQMVLKLGISNFLLIRRDGVYEFPGRFGDGEMYQVVVETSADDQTCIVRNGTGTIQSADVRDIRVECATDS